MNLFNLVGPGLLGLILVLVFFVLMLIFAMLGRSSTHRSLREIPAFSYLRRGIGLAVEAGSRLHISLGHGGIDGPRGSSALVGLSLLQRIGRVAAISDRPPIATSGEAILSLLSQDALASSLRASGAAASFDPAAGQLTGITPFAYAAGAVALISDEQVSVNLLAGSFGSEVALLTDTAERSGSLTLAGCENLSGQAIFYATAQAPLIGEELYAAGAYIQVGPMHLASLRVQDVFRWGIILVILGGALLKFVGF